VGTGNCDPEVPELLIVLWYCWETLSPGWGLSVRLTTSSCKIKFVENLLREKSYKKPRLIYRAVAPLVMSVPFKEPELKFLKLQKYSLATYFWVWLKFLRLLHLNNDSSFEL
jgi:hypothetical protein